MTAQTQFRQEYVGTATASYDFGGHMVLPMRVRAILPDTNRRISVMTAAAKGDGGIAIDPEEAVLARLRTAEQSKRRAEAHARIEAKRTANPVDALLALLDLPEYKIEVSDEVLRDILESYPEDD